MKQIGIISDTHGYLDEAVFRHFETCDEIWHVGDFGDEQVIENLSKFKPLRGVYGNIDGQAIRHRFPEKLLFFCEDIQVLMIHIGGYPGRYSSIAKEELNRTPVQLFLSGHSHILKILFDEKIKCLHINPGAAGKQGWHKVRTLVRLTIDGSIMRNCEVIELGKR
ncbi:MAG: metallophosphoesterase family protein [Bacteroidetes bacterium]|nr:metallophosphoesterase family protein [Bacteroidota bacterium]MBS1740181.1 metallophosphoesterase family protein [Bacteroidota bacterium]